MEYKDLRPPQQKAVNMLRSVWKTHRTHMLYAPVAFGKTAFAAYLTKSFVERGKRVLFIAPYTILINQTIERFSQYGLPAASVIWCDHPDYDKNALIQIASADTLIRRDFPDVDLVIVDEAHLRRKKLLTIQAESKAHWVGLSGTPFSPWLGTYYGSLIKPCTMRELIDAGYLSDYEFYAPSKPDLKGVKSSNTAYGQDYKEQEVAEIMGEYKLVGDIVQNWIENGKNLPTIAFCCNVKHAHQISKEFNIAGVASEVMTAETPQHERDAIIRRFEEGITKIICNVGVLVAGFDSDVRCIIYARPTKSEMRWVQTVGRSLRAVDRTPELYKEYLEKRQAICNNRNPEAAAED